VSCLDEKGQPTVVQQTRICPPRSRLGPITDAERRQSLQESLVAGVYEKVVDRESAFEKLTTGQDSQTKPAPAPAAKEGGFFASLFGSGGSQTPSPNVSAPLPSLPRNEPRPRGRQPDSLVETVAKSAARTVGSTLGREILRGVLGSIFGGRRR